MASELRPAFAFGLLPVSFVSPISAILIPTFLSWTLFGCSAAFETTSSEDLFSWLDLETNVGVEMTVFHKEGATYVFPPANGRISSKAVIGKAIHRQSGNAVAVELPLRNIERILLGARIVLYVKGDKRYQFEPPDWEFGLTNGIMDVVRGKGIVTDLRANKNQLVEFQIPFDQVDRFRIEQAGEEKPRPEFMQIGILFSVGILFVLILVFSSISNR